MALWGNTDADGSKPKYLSDADKAKCFFVSAEEAAVSTNKEKGITGAGWWLVNTFVDADGTTRYKSECLVAMSVANATSGDAADDATVSDTAITITVSGQPTDQSTKAPAGGVLTVTRAGTAATGTASYTEVTGTTSGSGTGAKFTVARAGGVYTVTVTSAGSGYAATDTITVLGSALGGVDTTNDLVITVATVATAAATFSVTATVNSGSVTYQWQKKESGATRWVNVSGATSASLALTGLTVAADNGDQYRVVLGSSSGAKKVTSDAVTLTVTAA